MTSTALVFASGPDNQYGYKTPIVRIGLGNAFQGTGTIIGNQRVAGKNGDPDQGYFCVLTADHVVAKGVDGMVYNNLSVGFGKLHDVSSLGFPLAGAYLPNATVVARKGIDKDHPDEKVDMAVVKVPYGVYDTTFDAFVMPISPNTIVPGEAFSSAGYGNQGARFVEKKPRPGGIFQAPDKWWNGYQGNGKYEEQRSYYNNVDGIIPKDDWADPAGGTYNPNDPSDPYGPQGEDPMGYKYEAMVYSNTSPTDRTALVDEGVGFNGDSGAPYMAWDGVENTIVGIHTYGIYLKEAGIVGRVKPWGFGAGGVHLNFQYRAWIMTACSNPVPEPSSLAACAVGLAGFCSTLKRKRRH